MEERSPGPEDRRRARINAPALSLFAWLGVMAVVLITAVVLLVYVA
jgi:hypothetical protein